MIGTFGDIVFAVGGGSVRTFDNFTRRSGAVFARHGRAGSKPVVEFTGRELDDISFSIRFADFMGVDPRSAIEALRAAQAQGLERPLIIGGRVLGNFVITEITENWIHVTAGGRITDAAVSVQMLEYV